MDDSLRGFIKETSRDAGYRKAAKFLMLLGKEEAARVLRHLDPQEVEGITREIARTQKIEAGEAAQVLEEFGYVRQTKDLIASGGIAKAEEMLVSSLGREKADEILERVKKEMAPPPFSFLQDIDVHQTIMLLRDESPPVMALILAHLEPKLAARILSALPADTQKQVVPRIAKMSRVSPDVVRRAEDAVKEKLRTQGKVDTDEVNGKAVLTEILRFLDPSKEESILGDLDPNVANEIRKSLFTVDAIFRIPDKDLQGALRNYADREIALMLKGMEDALKKRILDNVSERRGELIRSDMDTMGPQPKSKADGALQDFLEYLQLLEQKGEITVPREHEKFV
jgi:flagellar motor switch protein FliG